MNYGLLFLALSCLAAIFSAIVAFISNKRSLKYAEQTIELGKENNRISEENNRINQELMKIQKREQFPDWQDIKHYIKVIVQKMKFDRFVPDWIIVSSERDVIIASMIIQILKEEGILTKSVPVSVSMVTREYSCENEFYCESIELTNANWYIVIPKHLPIKDVKNDKILIVRDHSSTGVCFNKMIKHLTQKEIGISEDNIKTSCIARMETIKYMPPDYCCLTTDNIWFPWGKSL